jgi:hypothetical protein
MAENEANFREVLDVEVNVPKFVDGLNKLTQAYQQWKNNTADSGSVLGAGLNEGLTREMRSLTELLETLTHDVSTALNTITNAAESKVDASASRVSARLRAAQKLAQDIEIEQEGTEERTREETFKYEQWWKEAIDKREKREERAESGRAAEAEKERKRAFEYEQWWISALNKIDAQRKRVDASRVRPGEEVEAAQDRANAESAARRVREIREREEVQRKFNTAVEETNRLVGKVDAASSTSVRDKLGALRKALAEVRAESAKLQASLAGRTGGPTKDTVAEQSRLNQLLREEASLLNNINNVTKSNEGLLTRIVGHWRQSLAHLVRFFFLWQLLQGVVSAFSAAIAVPFKLIADGVRYLQNLETQTSDLTGVLLAAGKYSEDVAENFIKSRQAAKELTELLEEAAIRSNIPAEQIEKTFRALLTGGAASGVKNLEELVELAQVFQQTLTAAGVGALAAQGSIEEITKLFVGTSENTNKFLRGLKLSREEWEKIRKEGLAHGDLVERLRDRFAPYLKAVEGAANDQERLVKQITLLKDRIAAVASENLFGKATEAIKEAISFIDSNRDKISAFLKILADSIVDIGEKLKAAFANPFTRDTLENLLLFRRIFYEIAAAAELGAKSLTSGITFEKRAKAMAEYVKARLDIAKGEKEVRDLFERKPFVGPRQSNQPYTPFPTEPIVDPQRRLITAGFEEEKQRYLTAQEDIQEASKRTRQQIDLDLADRAITQEEATKRIAASINAETNALVSLDRVFEEQIAKTRRDLLSDKGGKPEEQQAAVKRFEAQIEALRRSQQKRNQQLLDELNRAERASLRERVNAETASYEERNKALEQSIENRKRLLSAAREADILTELQYFEKVADLDDEAYETKQALLFKRLKDVQNSATESIKVEGEIMRLESEHSAQQRAYSQQYQTLKEQESIKLAEQAAQLREINNQALETYLRLIQLLSPEQGYGKAIKDIINLRSQELDALEDTTRRHLEMARAKNMESDETRRLTVELRQLGAQRADLFAQQIQEINSGTTGTTARSLLIRNAAISQGRTLNSRAQDAANNLANFDRDNPDIDLDEGLRAQRKALEEDFKAASEASRDFADTLRDQVLPTWQRAFRSITDIMLGSGFKEAWSQATTGMEKAGVASEAAANALANIRGLVNTFKQGREEGGILGGVGAVTSALAPALSSIPVIGQFLPAIGGVLSFVGGLFTAAAKRIAEDVKKSFSRTLEEYQSGNASLVETIQTLERQRLDAISRLSGKKGGRDELNDILPEFDREISNLRKEQQEIVQNFDTALNYLRLQNDTLEQVQKQWQGINDQVKEYIGAGGDAAKAAEFLSLQLGKIRQDTLEDLEQAEQDAIQEALKLNDLLEERNKLVQDFRQKEFDLINSNSIERRQAGSVVRGRELDELRKQHQESLNNIDQQIRMSTIRVQKEREVFQFSTDIAELHRRDEELTLKFLDAQIQRYREMKDLVSSIVFGPNGWASSSLPSAPVISIGTVTVTGYDNATQAGRDFMDGVMDEYNRRDRMVLA